MSPNNSNSCRFALKICLLGLFSLLLIACSQTPLKEPGILTSAEPPPNQWVLKGKLGARTNDRYTSVTIHWQQKQNDFLIRLQGPLGQGSAIIRGNEKGVSIEQPGKSTLSSTQTEQLLSDTFGWELPLEQLPYWVRGLAYPNSPFTEVQQMPNGTITHISQDGWRLNFSRHNQQDKWILPGRVKAVNEGTQLTLIIKEWLFEQ